MAMKGGGGGGGGGRVRGGLPRDAEEDDTNLCWEITRVLFIVAAILVAVVAGAFYLNQKLADATPLMSGMPDLGRELEEDEAE
jgi:hypothetical protein